MKKAPFSSAFFFELLKLSCNFGLKANFENIWNKLSCYENFKCSNMICVPGLGMSRRKKTQLSKAFIPYPPLQLLCDVGA